MIDKAAVILDLQQKLKAALREREQLLTRLESIKPHDGMEEMAELFYDPPACRQDYLLAGIPHINAHIKRLDFAIGLAQHRLKELLRSSEHNCSPAPSIAGLRPD